VNAQGDSCLNPIDLNPFIPATGNGQYNLTVDNSSSGQFYTYTATQVGVIEMSSAYSNAPGDSSFDTWLRVYDSNCNLIFDEDDSPGMLGGVEFRADVVIGDTYIFEWANHEWAGVFNVEFIYHVPVTGITCNGADNLVLGINLADNWFGAKYYTYTAIQDGLLKVSTCEHPWAYYRNIEILDACNGNLLGNIDYSCDIEDDGRQLATYNITNGETVIVKMEGYVHMHHDYDFTASFDEALSLEEESITSFNVFPNPINNEFNIDINNVDNVNSISLFDLSGKALTVIWRKVSINNIKVDISHLQEGVYIVVINHNTNKIIIKK